MKINLVKNTVTNYISMVVKMLQGILVTRWLLGHLGTEYYGLWSLLWAFFCYSLLLDFGFGVTAQKYTSIGLYKTEPGKYNRILSTIFCFHACMSVLIAIGTYIASFFVVSLFKLGDAPLEKVELCRNCFLAFGLGAALIFPTGIFPEMLVGLQKIYLRNYLIMISKIIEIIGILIIFSLNGSIFTLIYFTLILNATLNLSMFFFIHKLIPTLKLRLWIDCATFREIFHFSGFIYMGSLARMLWGRGTTLVVSVMCGLTDLALMQLGGRIPFLMTQMVAPYQENISPVSSMYYSQGKHRVLAKILLNSMRWNSFLSTGMTVGIVIFAPELLKLLFNYQNDTATQICRWMVISYYVTQVFRTIPESFMIMAEQHRRLSWIRIGETTAYISLNIVLLRFFPVTSIVILALVLKTVFLSFFIAPLILRYLRIGIFRFLFDISLKPFLATLPLIVLSFLFRYFFDQILPYAVIMFTCGILGAIAYIFIFAFWILDRNERIFIIKNFHKNTNKA